MPPGRRCRGSEDQVLDQAKKQCVRPPCRPERILRFSEDDEREIEEELESTQFSENEENPQVPGAEEVSYYTDAELIEDEACDDGDTSLLNSRSNVKCPYNHTVVEVVKRPWGLREDVTTEVYRSDPICYLSIFNYKFNALVGTNRAD